MGELITWIGVALLGGAGAVARFAVGSAVAARAPAALPWGTIAVNLSGAFLLGLLAGADVTGDALLLAGTALLGSYTTFSTWMLESSVLRRERRLTLMWLNLGGSLLLGLGAAALGRAIA